MISRRLVSDHLVERPIILILQDESHVEKKQSKSLRDEARNIIEGYTKSQDPVSDTNDLPGILLQLLTQIIKPLFSTTPSHPKLTSTGRKVLVNNTLPGSIDKFSSFELENDENRPLWKNGWTGKLLLYILDSYTGITDVDTRKKSIEAHFYLLVPPILKQLDDSSMDHKCCGCVCLRVLCENVGSVSSSMLKKSGLTDVFVETLRNDFSMLPSLTEEEDSLRLLRVLYPAYRGLVRARFVVSQLDRGEMDLKQAYLTVLLRHQLIYGLTHLSTGEGVGSTMSVPLTTFLISQIGPILEDMGMRLVIHLQVVVPMLQSVLTDPFTTSVPGMVLEAVNALLVVVQISWKLVQDRWWEECLRGVVTCWLNTSDDLDDSKRDEKKTMGLREVQVRLRVLTMLLKDVVGEGFSKAESRLVKEEPSLKALFESKLN